MTPHHRPADDAYGVENDESPQPRLTTPSDLLDALREHVSVCARYKITNDPDARDGLARLHTALLSHPDIVDRDLATMLQCYRRVPTLVPTLTEVLHHDKRGAELRSVQREILRDDAAPLWMRYRCAEAFVQQQRGASAIERAEWDAMLPEIRAVRDVELEPMIAAYCGLVGTTEDYLTGMRVVLEKNRHVLIRQMLVEGTVLHREALLHDTTLIGKLASHTEASIRQALLLAIPDTASPEPGDPAPTNARVCEPVPRRSSQ